MRKIESYFRELEKEKIRYFDNKYVAELEYIKGGGNNLEIKIKDIKIEEKIEGIKGISHRILNIYHDLERNYDIEKILLNYEKKDEVKEEIKKMYLAEEKKFKKMKKFDEEIPFSKKAAMKMGVGLFGVSYSAFDIFRYFNGPVFDLLFFEIPSSPLISIPLIFVSTYLLYSGVKGLKKTANSFKYFNKKEELKSVLGIESKLE